MSSLESYEHESSIKVCIAYFCMFGMMVGLSYILASWYYSSTESDLLSRIRPIEDRIRTGTASQYDIERYWTLTKQIRPFIEARKRVGNILPPSENSNRKGERLE